MLYSYIMNIKIDVYWSLWTKAVTIWGQVDLALLMIFLNLPTIEFAVSFGDGSTGTMHNQQFSVK